ncbi:MAG: shikimate dehydrogenase [Atopococcus tabaci]|uniref:Shikimate dehydrogenase (NADP(+)) n=1 Tax=Atopococcus tabaci TaxID=269774 RepID=A0AA43UCV1_9LACT|nr:shikimate dehydrogenase [Atopococcus tabaci]
MNFYGLFGYPLGHSMSPMIHKIIYEKMGIDAAYKLFEVEEEYLAQALDSLKILDIRGANVTIPYKKKVIPLLDQISPKAEKLQAVNTIKNKDGILEGYNTDYDGVVRTFERQGWTVQNQSVYILGTGGASQAAAHALQDQGGWVTLVSRSPDKKNIFPVIDYQTLEEVEGNILVNTTPIGMPPKIDQSPVSDQIVSQFDIIFDATYDKVDNKLLKTARSLGKECVNGLEMLVGQAIAAVEIWEDISIDDSVMDDILSHVQKEWM